MSGVPILRRITQGSVLAMDYSAVPDGTELNGHDGWVVFQNGGSGNNLYEIRDGHIQTKASTTTQLALWGTATAGLPGQCVSVEVSVPGLDTTVAGAAANGYLDHSENVHCWLESVNFEWRHRSGTADYGQGVLFRNGAHNAGIAVDTWALVRLGVVHQPSDVAVTPRGALYVGGTAMGSPQDVTLGTGANSGTAYPGVFAWGATGAKFRNLLVTRDHRIAVVGLAGNQGFRLYDGSDNVLASSGTQSGGTAHVNAGPLSWPITGYVQVFDDTGTWADPSTNGRYPASGSAPDMFGGDVFEMATSPRYLVQVNWDDTDQWPAFWTDPATKDLSPNVTEIHLQRQAGNPDIQVDTAEVVVDDPNGDYIPANPNSAIYPNVRLGRKMRIAYTHTDGEVYPLFYGTISEYQPHLRWPKRRTTIRAESPLRALVQAPGTVPASTGSTEVVASGGAAGILVDVLDGVAGTIVPTLNRQLDHTPDQVSDFAAYEVDSIGDALQQLALITDSIYWAKPLYRQFAGSPDWVFRWQARSAKLGSATADFEWDTEDGDCDDLTLRYTGDVV